MCFLKYNELLGKRVFESPEGGTVGASKEKETKARWLPEVSALISKFRDSVNHSYAVGSAIAQGVQIGRLFKKGGDVVGAGALTTGLATGLMSAANSLTLKDAMQSFFEQQELVTNLMEVSDLAIREFLNITNSDIQQGGQTFEDLADQVANIETLREVALYSTGIIVSSMSMYAAACFCKRRLRGQREEVEQHLLSSDVPEVGVSSAAQPLTSSGRQSPQKVSVEQEVECLAEDLKRKAGDLQKKNEKLKEQLREAAADTLGMKEILATTNLHLENAGKALRVKDDEIHGFKEREGVYKKDIRTMQVQLEEVSREMKRLKESLAKAQESLEVTTQRVKAAEQGEAVVILRAGSAEGSGDAAVTQLLSQDSPTQQASKGDEGI